MDLKTALWASYALFAASVACVAWFGIAFANGQAVPKAVLVLSYLWPVAGFAIALFRKKIAESGPV